MPVFLHLTAAAASAALAMPTAASTVSASPTLLEATSTAEARSAKERGRDFTFSFIGLPHHKIGDNVSNSDIQDIMTQGDGVDRSVPASLVELTDRDGAQSFALESAANTLSSRPYVFKTWRDSRDKEVVLWSDANLKLVYTHNVTWEVARAVTQKPRSLIYEGGPSYRYEALAQKITCTGFWFFPQCKVVDSVTVRTIIDYRNQYDRTKGIVTTYCPPYQGACPSFVKNAINR